MRENCTYSLSGGRWLARKRATSDPTPMKPSNKVTGQSPAAAEDPEGTPEGRARTKENVQKARAVPAQDGALCHPRRGFDHGEQQDYVVAGLDAMLEVGRHVDEGANGCLLFGGAQFQQGVALEKHQGGRVGSGVGGQLLTGGEAKQNHLAPLVAVQGLAQDAILGDFGLLAEVAHVDVRIGHWMLCFFRRFHNFTSLSPARPSFDGATPSATRNVTAREWSAM